MAKKEDNDITAEIAIINEQSIKDKIYEIRGTKVMLDFELAEIYGYTTSAFNQQVKRNEEKFPADFRFQLTKEEYQILLSQIVTTSWGGDRRTEPWVFSEGGIYMLMTVLKGELAAKQSIALIRTFQAMKNYVVNNQSLINQRDYLRLSLQVSDTQQTVQNIQSQLIDQGDRLNDLFDQMQDTVKKSEISPFMLDFNKPADRHEYLIFNGEPAKADETYMQIYSEAQKKIFIVDNYINIKTLRLLKGAKEGTDVIIFSDNLLNMLHASDDLDFRREFPNINITYKRTNGIMHDRFIVLDYGTEDEKMFHCGASSKDAGERMTAIMEFRDDAAKKAFHSIIQKMLRNRELVLR